MPDHEDTPPAARREKRGSGGGFKWKAKPRHDDSSTDRRDRDRDNYRSSRDRDRDYRPSDRDRDSRRDRDRDSRRSDRDDRRYRSRSRERRSHRADRSRSPAPREDTTRPPKREAPKQTEPAPAPAAAADGEEMIIVNVNDRLGTKAAIPCFASDKIGEFKVMVAARIGREPHEILLKRQGERPFKDHITLGDYEIGNGVQLDLEVDTGD